MIWQWINTSKSLLNVGNHLLCQPLEQKPNQACNKGRCIFTYWSFHWHMYISSYVLFCMYCTYSVMYIYVCIIHTRYIHHWAYKIYWCVSSRVHTHKYIWKCTGLNILSIVHICTYYTYKICTPWGVLVPKSGSAINCWPAVGLALSSIGSGTMLALTLIAPVSRLLH